MGWTNSHLYEFDVNNCRISGLNEEYDDDFGEKSIDASTATLDSIITDETKKFSYTYDFGDN